MIKRSILLSAASLVISVLGYSTAIAGTPTNVSFSAINKFEDRLNALRIEGIDRNSGQTETLLLYRFNDARGGSESLLSNYNVRHKRCYDYILKVMDQPGTFFLTLRLTLRDDPNDFSRESSDQIDGCDLERQVPTAPSP